MTAEEPYAKLARQQMTELDEEISFHFREIERCNASRYRLQSKIAALDDAYAIPKPGRRTKTQEEIVRCPRCGENYKVAA